MRSITPADVPVAIKDESVEVRLAEVGEMTVGYFRFAKGTDLRPALAGLPGDMCQCPHWGYVQKGRLTFRFSDHEEVLEAGDAFYVPPGHIPVVEAGTEYVQFSPREELRVVSETIAANMAKMNAGV
jgi:hypothetical protein